MIVASATGSQPGSGEPFGSFVTLVSMSVKVAERGGAASCGAPSGAAPTPSPWVHHGPSDGNDTKVNEPSPVGWRAEGPRRVELSIPGGW
jgi:hypothetical protein